MDNHCNVNAMTDHGVLMMLIKEQEMRWEGELYDYVKMIAIIMPNKDNKNDDEYRKIISLSIKCTQLM